MSFLGDLFGSGGGDANVGSTNITTTGAIAPEAKPFVEEIFGEAQKQFKEDEFRLFPGPRIAEFDPLQQKAFTGLESLSDVGLASFPSIASSAALAGQAQAAGAEGLRQLDITDIDRLSNPYQQAVIDIQKREALRDFEGVTQPQLDFLATQAGGFGGSRHGVVEAEAYKNLQEQLGDIQATGSLQAYNQALAEFGKERQRQASGAGQYASFAQQFPSQATKELTSLQAVGETKQSRDQRALDIALSDFLTEEAFPKQQLGEYASLIRGFPVAGRSTKEVTSLPSVPLSQQLLGAAGTGIGLAGAFGAFNKKSGGRIGSLPRGMQSGGQVQGGLASLERHQNNMSERIKSYKRNPEIVKKAIALLQRHGIIKSTGQEAMQEFGFRINSDPNFKKSFNNAIISIARSEWIEPLPSEQRSNIDSSNQSVTPLTDPTDLDKALAKIIGINKGPIKTEPKDENNILWTKIYNKEPYEISEILEINEAKKAQNFKESFNNAMQKAEPSSGVSAKETPQIVPLIGRHTLAELAKTNNRKPYDTVDITSILETINMPRGRKHGRLPDKLRGMEDYELRDLMETIKRNRRWKSSEVERGSTDYADPSQRPRYRASGGQIQGGLSSLETHQNNETQIGEEWIRVWMNLPENQGRSREDAIAAITKKGEAHRKLNEYRKTSSDYTPEFITDGYPGTVPYIEEKTISLVPDSQTSPRSSEELLERRAIVVAQPGNRESFEGLLERQAAKHKAILSNLEDFRDTYFKESPEAKKFHELIKTRKGGLEAKHKSDKELAQENYARSLYRALAAGGIELMSKYDPGAGGLLGQVGAAAKRSGAIESLGEAAKTKVDKIEALEERKDDLELKYAEVSAQLADAPKEKKFAYEKTLAEVSVKLADSTAELAAAIAEAGTVDIIGQPRTALELLTYVREHSGFSKTPLHSNHQQKFVRAANRRRADYREAMGWGATHDRNEETLEMQRLISDAMQKIKDYAMSKRGGNITEVLKSLTEDHIYDLGTVDNLTVDEVLLQKTKSDNKAPVPTADGSVETGTEGSDNVLTPDVVEDELSELKTYIPVE